jgi:cell division septal protein FtsQ
MKDYHRKKYQNPFFKRPGATGRSRRFRNRRESFGSWHGKLIVILLMILLGGAIYFIFYSPYFSIRQIEISGLQKIDSNELRGIVDNQTASRRFLIFPQNNIFVFDEKSAEKEINERYALNYLKIEKRLPGSVSISVEEKIPALIWKTAEKFYLVDGDGVIIREIQEGEVSGYQTNQPGANMALVFDESNEITAVKEQIISRKKAEAVVNLQNTLARTTGLQIVNFTMTNRGDLLIKCLTNEGWQIYFSPTDDLDEQIQKLSVFLKEKNQEDRRGLLYVDLRFEDRVYYK